MKKQPVDVATAALLPGCGFADTYGFTATGRPVDAPAVAVALFRCVPAWTAGLMRLRNRLAGVLGLRTAELGSLPVLFESPELVVLGFNDRHLDFRIAIRVGDCRRVTVSTLVRTHNRLGRAYLAAVLPFHRVIVAASLARTVAELTEG